jgi:hypothetical protein
MPRIIRLEPAKDGKHKWIAIFQDNRKTKFGAYGASDYTIHKDLARRDRYRARHKKDLETNDPYRAGYLSYYILWNKPTLEESVKDYNRLFDK